jgi:VCBS repeat-containing protein
LADQFTLGADGQYTYIGDKMEDLVAALQDNTTAVNKQQMD